MKAAYPTTTTWPYVLIVAAMFGAVILPHDLASHGSGVVSRLPIVRILQACRRLDQQARLIADLPAGKVAVAQAPMDAAQSTDVATPRPVGSRTKPVQISQVKVSTPRKPASWYAQPIQPLPVDPEPPVNNRVLPRRPSRSDPLPAAPRDLRPADLTPPKSHSDEVDQRRPTPPQLPNSPEPPRTSPSASPFPRPTEDTGRRRWPRSERLHDLLDRAAKLPQLAPRVQPIRDTLETLERQPIGDSAEQIRLISRLRTLTARLKNVTGLTLDERQLASRLSYAVERRAAVWQPLTELVRAHAPAAELKQAWTALQRGIGELRGVLASGEYQDSWAAFLGLPELQGLSEASTADFEVVAETAEKMLRRFHAPELDPDQVAFLDSPPLRTYEQLLRSVIATKVSPADLVYSLEAYETAPNRLHGDVVIDQLRRWQSSPEAARYQPAIGAITTHYRNANLRLAVSQELLNRLVPAVKSYSERVQDNILGAQVRGQNSTWTALSVTVVPDPQRIRLRLHANGHVQSSTASRKGPVTIYNRGKSVFSADKQLLIQPDGIYLTRAQASAQSGTSLVGLQSDLDDVPLLGWLVRTFAMQQHDDQRPLLRAEIVRRIRRSATEKMDREVQERLANTEQRVNRRVLEPLRKMDLDPRAVEMRTTTDRVIMRSRLASPFQFGAHTPRPQARRDSLLSLQVHQSAANNLIEQLDLHGKRMSLDELAGSLSRRLGIQGFDFAGEDHQDVMIEFADHHPLEFEFENGQITLTIHFAELDNGRRKWRNFSVRGYYRADIDQLDVELVREEGIELISERLGFRDQLALRSIFTKVLARNHRLQILKETIAQEPRLQDLEVTQLTIRDGWLGLALGETPGETRMVDQRRNRPR